MKNLELGKFGEELVKREYLKQGFSVVDKNIRFHLSRQIGEIDLVCVKGKEIVFVEVKTRRNKKFGEPIEAVNYTKQAKLVKSAKMYLVQRPQYDEYDWRIDIAEVVIDKSGNSVIILENSIEDRR